MLHITHSAIQFPTVVLQQSPDLLPSQYIMEDTTKSSSLDFRSILSIFYTRNRGHIRTRSDASLPQETLWMISFM